MCWPLCYNYVFRLDDTNKALESVLECVNLIDVILCLDLMKKNKHQASSKECWPPICISVLGFDETNKKS